MPKLWTVRNIETKALSKDKNFAAHLHGFRTGKFLDTMGWAALVAEHGSCEVLVCFYLVYIAARILSKDWRHLEYTREEWVLEDCPAGWSADLLLTMARSYNVFVGYHYFSLAHAAVGNVDPAAVVHNRTILRIVCQLRLHDVTRKAGGVDLKWRTFTECFASLHGKGPSPGPPDLFLCYALRSRAYAKSLALLDRLGEDCVFR